MFSYSYREAVIDGWLVDHEPPIRIVTERSAEDGIHWKVGEQRPHLRSRHRHRSISLRCPTRSTSRSTVQQRRSSPSPSTASSARNWPRTSIPTCPGKTLVFCATDAHADWWSALLKEALDAPVRRIDDDAVMRRSPAAPTSPLQAHPQLQERGATRRSPSPSTCSPPASTCPEIANLVFLRRVRSRILYEQMIGRATRSVPATIGKEIFEIFDAVDLYAILEDVTTMKPVVANPGTTFALLADLMGKALDDRPATGRLRAVPGQAAAQEGGSSSSTTPRRSAATPAAASRS